MEKSQARLDILKKIEVYEQNGWFDRDIEEDPPKKTLQPQDYGVHKVLNIKNFDEDIKQYIYLKKCYENNLKEF